MINIEVICWHQPTKKGYPLRIRILDTINKKDEKKSTYIGLKLYLCDSSIFENGELVKKGKSKYWNYNTKKIRKSFPEKAEYDKIIEAKLREVKKQHAHKTTQKEVVKDLKTDRFDFMEALQTQIEDLDTRVKLGYIKRFTSVRGHLLGYLKKIKKPTLYFDEITPAFLKRFQMYLYSQNISNTTQRESYFKGFKRVFNIICEENQIVKLNPFSILKYDTDPKRKARTLKIDAIQEVIAYDLINNNNIEAFRSKLLFLFSFYGSGVRPADIFTIRWSDITIKTEDYSKEEVVSFAKAKLNNQPKPIIERRHSLLIHYIMGKTNEDVYLKINPRFLYILTYFLDKSLQNELIFDDINKVFYEDEDLQFWMNRDKFRKPINDILESFQVSDELLKMKPDNYYHDDFKHSLINNNHKVINSVVALIRKQQRINANKYIFSDINENLDRDHKFDANRRSFYNKVSYEKTKYNDGLKDIAKKYDMTVDLTGYVARHSFASLIMSESHDLLLVSKALKHSDTKITEQYLKELDNEEYQSDISENIIDDILRF